MEQFNFEKVKFISRSDYLKISRNRPILAGDFLISMIGTIGEVARVKDTDLDFYGQNMYLIRLDNNLINSDFFLHFFDSPKMKNYFNSIKNNSGQGYLKSKDIENLLIPENITIKEAWYWQLHRFHSRHTRSGNTLPSDH